MYCMHILYALRTRLLNLCMCIVEYTSNYTIRSSFINLSKKFSTVLETTYQKKKQQDFRKLSTVSFFPPVSSTVLFKQLSSSFLSKKPFHLFVSTKVLQPATINKEDNRINKAAIEGKIIFVYLSISIEQFLLRKNAHKQI